MAAERSAATRRKGLTAHRRDDVIVTRRDVTDAIAQQRGRKPGRASCAIQLQPGGSAQLY